MANPALLKREGATFYPLADGTTTLAVTFGGQSFSVPVKVAQATVQPPLSFRLDVMPVFMRAGCNTGSCHGAARGKDGFRISLFGFDPEGDHYRLTREMVGRRINLAVPSRQHAAGEVDRRGPAHRRQAVRGLERTLPDAASLDRGGRTQRRCEQAAQARRRWISIPARPCSTAKGRPSR